MDAASVLDLAQSALIVAAKLGAPVLVTALVVGFAISLFQSITQIQEVTSRSSRRRSRSRSPSSCAGSG